MDRSATQIEKDKKSDFSSSPEEIFNKFFSSIIRGESLNERMDRISFSKAIFDNLLEPKQISGIHFSSMRVYVKYDQEFDVSGPSFYIDKRKSELLKSIDDLESCFSDPEERHVKYFKFREELKEMRDTIDPKYWDLSRLILGCMDATTNTEAEDLTRPQVEAFRKVVEEISENIDCSEANSLLGILISADLKPIPDLKNLEPIEI